MPNYTYEITVKGLDRLSHLEGLSKERKLSPTMMDEAGALSALIDGPVEIPDTAIHFQELVDLFERLERRGYTRRSSIHLVDPSQDRRTGPQPFSGKFTEYSSEESREYNPPGKNGHKPERPKRYGYGSEPGDVP